MERSKQNECVVGDKDDGVDDSADNNTDNGVDNSDYDADKHSHIYHKRLIVVWRREASKTSVLL
eukprot:6593317-Ditylum_brightwellii.AAC.1